MEARKTEKSINEAREIFRPVAARSSLLFFILNDLSKVNALYVFSLKAFKVVFFKAMELTPPKDEIKERVTALVDEITFATLVYTTRGLFEKDKLTFM